MVTVYVLVMLHWHSNSTIIVLPWLINAATPGRTMVPIGQCYWCCIILPWILSAATPIGASAQTWQCHLMLIDTDVCT